MIENAALSTTAVRLERSGLTARLVCAALDGNGARVLAGDGEGRIELWDSATGTLVKRFSGHRQRAWAVAFLPDGVRALSGSNDGTLRLWALDSGECIRVFEGDRVEGLAVSPDGRLAFSGGQTLSLWDIETGVRLSIFDGGPSVFQGVAIAPNGAHAVACDAMRNELGLWTLPFGRCLRRFDAPGAPGVIAISPDGKHALSGENGPKLTLWDIRNRRLLRFLEDNAARGRVSALAFAHDARCAVSGDWSGAVRLWDLYQGRCVQMFQGSGWVLAVGFTQDNRQVRVVFSDGTLRRWEIESVPSFNELRGVTRARHAIVEHIMCGWILSTTRLAAAPAVITLDAAIKVANCLLRSGVLLLVFAVVIFAALGFAGLLWIGVKHLL